MSDQQRRKTDKPPCDHEVTTHETIAKTFYAECTKCKVRGKQNYDYDHKAIEFFWLEHDRRKKKL
jgi:predicted  nucleic acid-binding Zn ribbon protein